MAKRLDQEVEAAGGLFTPGVAPMESELLCHRLSVVLALLPLLLPDMPAAYWCRWPDSAVKTWYGRSRCSSTQQAPLKTQGG